jgi:hypothetical protein
METELMQETSACELPSTTGGANPPPDLTQTRQDGRRLVAAGRNIIARTVSRDAEGFMGSRQQEGGQ